MRTQMVVLLAAIVFASPQTPVAPSAQASESSPSPGAMLAFFGRNKGKPKSPLNRKQREYARTILSGLEKEAQLVFFSEDEGCKKCGKVKVFLEEISAMSPLLSLEILSLTGDADRAAELGVDKVPGIAILDGTGNSSGIRYFGTPLGFEFEAFLEAIVNTAHRLPGLQPETLAGLGAVKKPVTITVFVTQH